MLGGRAANKSKPPVGSLVDWSHPLGRNVALAWLLNEGSGAVANDASGKGRHGWVVNRGVAVPTWSASNAGFGTNQATANIANTPSPYGGPVISCAANYAFESGYIPELAGSKNYAYHIGLWRPAANADRIMCYAPVGSNELCFSWWNDSNFYVDTTGDTPHTSTAGQPRWYDILVTLWGGVLSLWLDGRLAAALSDSTSVTTSTSAGVRLGYVASRGLGFTGRCSHLTFWSPCPMRPADMAAMLRTDPFGYVTTNPTRRAWFLPSPPTPATAYGAALFPCCM